MKKFAFHVAIYLLVFPMILALTTAPGVILPQAMILAGNVKVTPLVTLFAPVVEEIFFRGFLQERLEDLGTLVDRYICPLSKGTGQRLSVVVQSLLFGAAHITGMQATCGAKMRLFCMASIFGFWQAQSKNKYQSLLAPIALHFARNAGTTVRRWLASALFPGGCEAKLLN